jgi:nucleotide-binding universal stress UspA family protein
VFLENNSQTVAALDANMHCLPCSVLVPLDGSESAERALAYAAELATAAGARLVLIRTAGADDHRLSQGADGGQPDEAQVYLQDLRSRLEQTGLVAEIAVPSGHAPAALLAEMDRQHPDLIVMTTHGRSSPRHQLLGSVAEAVVALGRAPVLLVRASSADALSKPALAGHRLLVPLDGSALGEAALPVAVHLARVLKSELVLFRTVVKSSLPYAVPTELMTDPDVDVQLAWDPGMDVKSAEASLTWIADRLRHHAPDVTIHSRVEVGDVVERIRAIDSAPPAGAEPRIGLIVMATHGRTGLSQALLGSTARTVLLGTEHPLVVVHPLAVRPDSRWVE